MTNNVTNQFAFSAVSCLNYTRQQCEKRTLHYSEETHQHHTLCQNKSMGRFICTERCRLTQIMKT